MAEPMVMAVTLEIKAAPTLVKGTTLPAAKFATEMVIMPIIATKGILAASPVLTLPKPLLVPAHLMEPRPMIGFWT